MIEAVPVLFVAAVAVATYVAARRYAADPSGRTIELDIARLQMQQTALTVRLQQATRENWSNDMVVNLSEQLNATKVELAQALSLAHRAAVAELHRR